MGAKSLPYQPAYQIPAPIQRDLDHRLIVILKESLIDCDIQITDLRAEIDSRVIDLRAAVARRDGVVRRLADAMTRAA